MDDVDALVKITASAHARRELLYLRALEKDDERAASSLLRSDPNIVRRLRAQGLDPEEGGEWELPRERSERMGRLWEACWRYHADRL